MTRYDKKDISHKHKKNKGENNLEKIIIDNVEDIRDKKLKAKVLTGAITIKEAEVEINRRALYHLIEFCS